jgi:hypothetical protein
MNERRINTIKAAMMIHKSKNLDTMLFCMMNRSMNKIIRAEVLVREKPIGYYPYQHGIASRIVDDSRKSLIEQMGEKPIIIERSPWKIF